MSTALVLVAGVGAAPADDGATKEIEKRGDKVDRPLSPRESLKVNVRAPAISNYDGVRRDSAMALEDVLDELNRRYQIRITINYHETWEKDVAYQREHGLKKAEASAVVKDGDRKSDNPRKRGEAGRPARGSGYAAMALGAGIGGLGVSRADANESGGVNSIISNRPGAARRERILEGPLHVVLRQLLLEVPSLKLTYVLRPDVIEVTTVEAVRAELGIAPGRPLSPLVQEELKEVPFRRAVRQLADSAGVTVVLDPAVVEGEDPNLTAVFTNVPVDNAVRVLAEMANYGSVQLDHVIFVTTAKRARKLRAEEALKASVVAPVEKISGSQRSTSVPAR